MEKMQCGAFSGLVAQTISYPLEVTRRRMQTIGILPSGQSAITELGVQETAGRPSSMVATMRLRSPLVSQCLILYRRLLQRMRNGHCEIRIAKVKYKHEGLLV